MMLNGDGYDNTQLFSCCSCPFFPTVPIWVIMWRNMNFSISHSHMYGTTVHGKEIGVGKGKHASESEFCLALDHHLNFHWLSQFICKGKVTKPIPNNGCCKHWKYWIHSLAECLVHCGQLIKVLNIFIMGISYPRP